MAIRIGSGVLVRFLGWKAQAGASALLFLKRISTIAITLAGIAISLFVFTPTFQEHIGPTTNFRPVFLASGALIGTILALVITLSMIPVQRSVEALTPTVGRIYKEDAVNLVLFLLLGIFSLASFFLAVVTELGIPQHLLVFAEFIILAASLDLLRWHNRRIAALLDPLDAINRVLARTTWELRHVQKSVARLARVDRRMMEPGDGGHSPEQLERAYYVHHFDPTRINFWATELAEIAAKAIGRGDTYLAVNAVKAIAGIGSFYLNQRRLNMSYTLKDYSGLLGCDADNILSPLYEHLQTINRVAVAAKSETVAIQVVRGLEQMIGHALQLRLPDPSDTRSPIVWLPLAYLKGVVEHAQFAGLDDVALEAGQVYVRLTRIAPRDAEMGSFYATIIEDLTTVVQAFAVARKGALADEALSSLMTVAHLTLDAKHFQLRDIVRGITDRLERLMPLALALEKATGASLITVAITVPYALTKEVSLGHLVHRAREAILPEERDWVSPYADFMDISEVIHRHLRNLAERNDMSNSHFTWHIAHTIRHIARAYLSILQKPVSTNPEHLERLVAQIGWYMSFMWAAFAHAKSIRKFTALECCEILAWIGLAFLSRGYDNIAEDAASDIAAVLDSFCKVGEGFSPYDIADFLVLIQHLRILAERRGRTALVGGISKYMDKPSELKDEVWPHVEKALEVRQRQLQAELDEGRTYRHTLDNSPMSLLRELLESGKK